MSHQQRSLLVLPLACLLLLVIGLVWWLNRGYSTISDGGYQYALAMVSACNRQDLARVQIIVKNVRDAHERQELPAYDAAVLDRIGQMAVEGDWERAAINSRELLKSQAR